MYTVLKKCRYISICDMSDLGTFASETVKHTNEGVVFRRVAVRKSVSNVTKSSNSSRGFFTV